MTKFGEKEKLVEWISINILILSTRLRNFNNIDLLENILFFLFILFK